MRLARTAHDRLVERAIASRLAVGLAHEDPQQDAFFGQFHRRDLPRRTVVLRRDHVHARDRAPRRRRLAAVRARTCARSRVISPSVKTGSTRARRASIALAGPSTTSTIDRADPGTTAHRRSASTRAVGPEAHDALEHRGALQAFSARRLDNPLVERFVAMTDARSRDGTGRATCSASTFIRRLIPPDHAFASTSRRAGDVEYVKVTIQSVAVTERRCPCAISS